MTLRSAAREVIRVLHGEEAERATIDGFSLATVVGLMAGQAAEAIARSREGLPDVEVYAFMASDDWKTYFSGLDIVKPWALALDGIPAALALVSATWEAIQRVALAMRQSPVALSPVEIEAMVGLKLDFENLEWLFEVGEMERWDRAGDEWQARQKDS